MTRKRLMVRAATGLLLCSIIFCSSAGLWFHGRAVKAWEAKFEYEFDYNFLVSGGRWLDSQTKGYVEIQLKEIQGRLQHAREFYATYNILRIVFFLLAIASLASIWLLWFLNNPGEPEPAEEPPHRPPSTP